MIVLLVDDREDRMKRMKAARPDDEVVWASTPVDAIILLGQSVTDTSEAGARPFFEEIWLDFHMGFKDVNGDYVAHALGCLGKYYHETPVHLHSTTKGAAAKMQFVLAMADFEDTKVKCFEDFYPTPVVAAWQPTLFKVGRGSIKLATWGSKALKPGYIMLPDDVVEWDGPEDQEPGLESWRLPVSARPQPSSSGGGQLLRLHSERLDNPLLDDGAWERSGMGDHHRDPAIGYPYHLHQHEGD